MREYYKDDWCTIYHGDCKDILPELELVDLVLTDPPYGINQSKGMSGGGIRLGTAKKYDDDWDKPIYKPTSFELLLKKSKYCIIWGGNYFTDILPQQNKWLVWNKEMTMPSYSDCELAWTNINGNTVKMYSYCGNGMLAKEKDRYHPTQKPLSLIKWCISFLEDANTIMDPFMGSGTTLRAAKDLNRKAIGVEIEEKYCEIAAMRLQQEVLDLR